MEKEFEVLNPEEFKKFEGVVDFKTTLLFQINRSLDCLAKSGDDKGVSFVRSINALEQLLSSKHDKVYKQEIRLLEKLKIRNSNLLNPTDLRIEYGLAKLGCLEKLMDRLDLLLGEVGNATE